MNWKILSVTVREEVREDREGSDAPSLAGDVDLVSQGKENQYARNLSRVSQPLTQRDHSLSRPMQ